VVKKSRKFGVDEAGRIINPRYDPRLGRPTIVEVVVAGVLYQLTPREPVAWDFGIGVVSAPRGYVGDSGAASDTMRAWLRSQGYSRAPDGGLGKAF